MNIQQYDIMNILAVERYENQRILAEKTGYSLGKVNSSVKSLKENGALFHYACRTYSIPDLCVPSVYISLWEDPIWILPCADQLLYSL